MPFSGLKVIELAGLAPAPVCGMIFSDFGANVIRVDRPDSSIFSDSTTSRGKRSIILNLKKSQGAEVFKRLCKKADVLIEPYRPGVMENLKLGPSVLCSENPRLVYARLTGYGQRGFYSQRAGHDLNYIAISGILSKFGPHGQKPVFPINLLGDFAGGSFICALGICMALIERSRSGKGQVIDSNMVEGSSYLSSWLWTSRTSGLPLWEAERGKNILDGGAPFYQTYKTKDGKYMAVGAVEPQFYKQLLEGLGLDEKEYPQFQGAELEKTFADIFASKTQEEWCKVFDSKDACVTPVLSLDEAHLHQHNADRQSFEKDGELHVPKPAPRLERTPGQISSRKVCNGEHTVEVLKEEGYNDNEIQTLLHEKAIGVLAKKSKL